METMELGGTHKAHSKKKDVTEQKQMEVINTQEEGRVKTTGNYS